MDVVKMLANRMISYDGNFRMENDEATPSDMALIDAGLKQAGLPAFNVLALACLASEYITTVEQYDNTWHFIAGAVGVFWDFAMSEGNNAVHKQIAEMQEEEEYDHLTSGAF